MGKVNFSTEEIRNFKHLFNKFCKREINAGRCDKDSCAECNINKAYEEIFDSLTVTHETTVTFTAKKAELYNRLLDIEPNDTDDAVEKAGYDNDSTIEVITAYFDDGYFADIKLCSGQTNFFGDAVLFNEEGTEECVLDCFDAISDGDTFEFESDCDKYIVTVKVEAEKHKITAYNIQWDIDIEEVLDALDDMTIQDASKVLKIPEEKYANMSTSERHDYAYSYFHHCPGAMADFLELPNCVEIPEGMTDDDEISDWLSDEYGYCHAGFTLNTD